MKKLLIGLLFLGSISSYANTIIPDGHYTCESDEGFSYSILENDVLRPANSDGSIFTDDKAVVGIYRIKLKNDKIVAIILNDYTDDQLSDLPEVLQDQFINGFPVSLIQNGYRMTFMNNVITCTLEY